MNPSKLTYTSQIAEDRAEKFITQHIGHHKISNAPAWRVKWRGEFLKLRSGKSSWATIGRAKSAFKNHIKRCGLHLHYERAVTNNDKLAFYDGKMTVDEFYAIILPEIEYVQG